VVRVNTEGFVLPPVIIFDSSNWTSRDFESVTRYERARMPQNIATDFRYDKENTSVFQKYFIATGGYCTMPEIQFCAILPLNTNSHPIGDKNAQYELHRLEQLLGLRKLVTAAQTANKEFCTCQEPENGNMILCDATKCTIGWYHKKCVSLDEEFEADYWFCSICAKSHDNFVVSKYDNEVFEDGIHEASDMRIQRVRSLNRAWNDHRWPHPSDVQKIMYRRICCDIEMETNQHKYRNTIECLEGEQHNSSTQNRAILRHNPSRITQIKQRFRATGRS
jgi:hypothetical protein